MHKPYIREVLTSNGVVITDGPNNEYVETLPNDNKTVVLLRRAIQLWKNNEQSAFLALIDNSDSYEDFSVDDRFVFKCTIFDDGEKITSISDILEDISIERSLQAVK